MSFSFAMAQKIRSLNLLIFGTSMECKDFGIDGSFNTTKIKTLKIPQEYAAISKSVAAILDQSPVSLS
jgi:penicillin amidase